MSDYFYILIGDVLNVIFKKQINTFIYQTGCIVIKVFNLKSKKKKNYKQKVECAKGFGCLFWIIIPIITIYLIYFI